MDPTIVPALITGAISLICLLMQHGLYAVRISRMKEKHDEKLAADRREHESRIENLKRENTERTTRFQNMLAAFAKYNESRTLSLERLWNAVSIASSAAQAMIDDSSSKKVGVLIERTTKFLQDISLFLNEAKLAPANLSLSKDDVHLIQTVRSEVVRLFLSLDLDSGLHPDYQKRLASCKDQLARAVEAFEIHVRAHTTPQPVT